MNLNLQFKIVFSYKYWLYTNGTEKLYDIQNDSLEKMDLMGNVDSDDSLESAYVELRDELFKLLSSEDDFHQENHFFIQ